MTASTLLVLVGGLWWVERCPGQGGHSRIPLGRKSLLVIATFQINECKNQKLIAVLKTIREPPQPETKTRKH